MPEVIFTTEAMHVTELAIHKMLGMQVAPPHDAHILVLPESPLVLNHLGIENRGIRLAVTVGILILLACLLHFTTEKYGGKWLKRFLENGWRRKAVAATKRLFWWTPWKPFSLLFIWMAEWKQPDHWCCGTS